MTLSEHIEHLQQQLEIVGNIRIDYVKTHLIEDGKRRTVLEIKNWHEIEPPKKVKIKTNDTTGN